MIEFFPQLNVTQSEFAPRVADYFDNLLAQRDAILASYDLTPETAEQFCNVRSTDEDRETMSALYERIVYVIEHKQIPPTEILILERNKEQRRIDAFFGKEAHIEVPPLPPAITSERIAEWKQQRFELRYSPPLILTEDQNYPGWKKKPSEVYFFRNIDHLQSVPENVSNPHLAGLAPHQLIGCWMLVDTRPKPNYRNDGYQSYLDDEEIQNIIRGLVLRNICNEGARYGTRNFISPHVFNNSQFWQPFYEHLRIDPDEAVIRLPRVIEQSVFGQGAGWNDTDTWEWAEEYYGPSFRFVTGNSRYGGVADVYPKNTGSGGDIGFRCVVVFSSP